MKRPYLIIFLPVMLCACQELPEQDVTEWINKNQGIATTRITKAIEQENPQGFTYQAKDRIDPFDMKKISILFSADPSAGNNFPSDMHRAREALEQYAIDHLRMVGTLRRPGKIIALVEVEKILHQVRVGSYLGQDMGRVLKITEDAIQIEETTQDANGEWRKRLVELKMKDK